MSRLQISYKSEQNQSSSHFKLYYKISQIMCGKIEVNENCSKKSNKIRRSNFHYNSSIFHLQIILGFVKYFFPHYINYSKNLKTCKIAENERSPMTNHDTHNSEKKVRKT